MMYELCIILICSFVGFIAGGFAVQQITENLWEKEAIEKGYAQYNKKTGKWEWK